MEGNMFMQNHFQKLPTDLQAKIMIQHGRAQHAPPRFKPGQRVRYKQSRVKEMSDSLSRITGHTNGQCGPMPFGELRIWGEPREVGNKDWLYDYEYGFGMTNEGSAYESDLIPY